MAQTLEERRAMCRRSSKQWRDNNLDRARATCRAWMAANVGRRREYERIRHLRRYKGRPVKNEKSARSATKSPSVLDLAWAAGFLEGEGWFGRNTKYSSGSEVVSAPQKQREPLDRLMVMFGGTLRSGTPDKAHPKNIYWSWRCSGVRARGVMMTMYQFMSPRRKEQISEALKGVVQCKPAA